MPIDMTLDQYFDAVVTPKDRQGRPAQIQDPVWASSDETVVQVTPGADPLTAKIDSIGVGQARVIISGDADLGVGVKPITGAVEFNILPGQAITLEITGTVADKP